MNTALSISPNILDLYDNASKGQAYLLEALCDVFNCQSTAIHTFLISEDPLFKPSPTRALATQDNLGILKVPPPSLSFDKETHALLFKSNEVVNCYLFIHYAAITDAQNSPFAEDGDELIEHVIEALNIAYKISQQENDLKSIHYVLAQYPIPAIAIDENQNTVFSNQAAQRTLQKVTASAVMKQQSLLELCQPDNHATLKQALIDSLSGKVSSSRHLIIGFNKAPLTVIVTTTNTIPNVFRHFSRNNITWVYLLQTDYTNTLKSHPDFLILGLSSTEVELSCALFNGQSVNNIAEERRVSKQTVRKQLQSILRKTNCETQESLMIFFFENYIHYGLNR